MKPARPDAGLAVGRSGHAGRRLWKTAPWRMSLCGLALWLVALAPWRPLSLPDEGRYVGVALEMLRSGDWLVPTLDGLPYFHKPPLFYWITAAALAVDAQALLAARSASLLAALAMASFTAWFARRWLGREAAAWAPLVLGTMPFFVGAAQFANLDLLVAACITGAIACLADGLLRDASDRGARGSITAAWILMALGVLAKGLIGLVLPLAVTGLWAAHRRGTAAAWLGDARRVLASLGPPVAAAIVLPWFVAVEHRHPGFVHYFVVEQHLRRYAGTGFNNPQPFWFYAPVVAVLTLPWFAFIGRGPATGGSADTAHAARGLCAWWIAVVLLFFSWPTSKLVGYVLPVLPPLALGVADRACRVHGARLHRRRLRLAVLVLAASGCALLVAAIARHQAGRNHASLVAVLEREAAPGEPVFAIELQPYDLGLHATVARPVVLVAQWADPDLSRHDDWRKELLDAARFAPARASHTLLDPAAARRAWCARPRSWIVAARAAGSTDPVLAGRAPRALTTTAGLWRVDGAQLAQQGLCP